MANPTTVNARTTAVLTGGGTTDYAADLDMNLTADGWVTVTVTPTLGSLVSITLTTHAGAAATPTGPMLTDAMVPVSRDMVAETGLACTFSVQCKQRYFRVGITGAGGSASGSDCVIDYLYEPKANQLAADACATSIIDGNTVVAAGYIDPA